MTIAHLLKGEVMQLPPETPLPDSPASSGPSTASQSFAHSPSDQPYADRTEGQAGVDNWAGIYGYVIAVISTAIATALSFGMRWWNGDTFLFPFFVAVIVTAWFGGPVPAWIATVISMLVVDYFFTLPLHTFVVSAASMPYFLAFVLCLAVTCLVVARQRRTEAMARLTQEEIAAHVAAGTSLLREANDTLTEKLERHRAQHSAATALFERSDALLLRLDAGGRLLDLNPAAARLTGLDRRVARSRSIYELLIPGGERAALQAALHDVASGRQPAAEGFTTWRGADNRPRRIRWTATAVDAGAETTEILCLGLDVTESYAR
ncbi:DUF4118 domain-containing protein [Dongia soli]|uniref:DUF4118 domain-containing protein n=1 Tax=Dongia soli TaxID=600628 RepID=A0ABU5EF83_9PROT|nr:DUF4118 domain-containing protein [Dongia soli]MDY0884674.1 DUF4118 domain-containing protein [Dongia soli]